MGLTGKIDNDIINAFKTNDGSTESNEFTFVAVIENEFKSSVNEMKSRAVYLMMFQFKWKSQPANML